jgi:hypothetical protein
MSSAIMSADFWLLIRQLAIAAPHEALADVLLAALKPAEPEPESTAPPPPDPPSRPKRQRRSSRPSRRSSSSRRRKSNGEGHANIQSTQALASRFWAKAEELSDVPWKLVADRLHANIAICQDAYRLRKLPPSVLPEQAESFAA